MCWYDFRERTLEGAEEDVEEWGPEDGRNRLGGGGCEEIVDGSAGMGEGGKELELGNSDDLKSWYVDRTSSVAHTRSMLTLDSWFFGYHDLHPNHIQLSTLKFP